VLVEEEEGIEMEEVAQGLVAVLSAGGFFV
jgi:hypothetical protein